MIEKKSPVFFYKFTFILANETKDNNRVYKVLILANETKDNNRVYKKKHFLVIFAFFG